MSRLCSKWDKLFQICHDFLTSLRNLLLTLQFSRASMSGKVDELSREASEAEKRRESEAAEREKLIAEVKELSEKLAAAAAGQGIRRSKISSMTQGASRYDVRIVGGGGSWKSVLSKGGFRGFLVQISSKCEQGGVKKSKNFAVVFNGGSLTHVKYHFSLLHTERGLQML